MLELIYKTRSITTIHHVNKKIKKYVVTIFQKNVDWCDFDLNQIKI